MSTPTLRDYVDDLLTAARQLREEAKTAEREEYEKRRAGWEQELRRRVSLMETLLQVLGIPTEAYKLKNKIVTDNHIVNYDVRAEFGPWTLNLFGVERYRGTEHLILKTFLYINPGDEYKNINLPKMFQTASYRQWPYGPLRREMAIYTAEAEQVIRAQVGAEMEHLLQAVDALPAFITEINAQRARQAAEEEERERQQAIDDQERAERLLRMEQEMIAEQWAAEIEADFKRQEAEAALATALELAPEALSAILRVIRWEIERHADKCF